MSEPGGGAPAGRRSLLGDARPRAPSRAAARALRRGSAGPGRLATSGRYRACRGLCRGDRGGPGRPPARRCPRYAGRRARREFHGRHAQTRKPEPGWVPMAERYRDPSSGVIMRVWIDPSDESRHYCRVRGANTTDELEACSRPSSVRSAPDDVDEPAGADDLATVQRQNRQHGPAPHTGRDPPFTMTSTGPRSRTCVAPSHGGKATLTNEYEPLSVRRGLRKPFIHPD